MPKEKNYNPVQEAKKAEKQKQLRKQKATLQTQRQEKLARRNPARIQRDIENLKQASESGEIRPHERQKLAELEKDLAAVNKARAALGDKAPVFREYRGDDDRGDRGGRGGRGGSSRGGGRGGVLGKRGRDGSRKDEESSDTDEDARDIPMPRDTPPPIPRKYLRGGYAGEEAPPEPKKPTIVYEAAPQVRDLRKEAARFVPAAVAQKLKQAKGEGVGLLDEEEFDKLEKEGYMKAATVAKDTNKEEETAGKGEGGKDRQDELDEFLRELDNTPAEGEAAGASVGTAKEPAQPKAEVIQRKPYHVAMEEVEDEDA